MSAQRKKEAPLLELDFFVRLMCRIALSQLFSDTIKKREIDPDIPNHKATYRNTFDMFLIWAQMQEFINGHMVHLLVGSDKKKCHHFYLCQKSRAYFSIPSLESHWIDCIEMCTCRENFSEKYSMYSNLIFDFYQKRCAVCHHHGCVHYGHTVCRMWYAGLAESYYWFTF